MLESLTFFGVSVEYFGVFRKLLDNSRSFHFGVTLEFSCVCVINTIVLQILQNYASYLGLQDYASHLLSKNNVFYQCKLYISTAFLKHHALPMHNAPAAQREQFIG
jgi:hypothetical protein